MNTLSAPQASIGPGEPPKAWSAGLPPLPTAEELRNIGDGELSDRINECDASITTGIDGLRAIARQALIKALKAGCYLSEAQARHKGRWLEWLKQNCPKISKSTAYRYIDLSRGFPHVGNSPSIGGIRQALIAIKLLPETGVTTPPKNKSASTPGCVAKGFVKYLCKISARLKSLPTGEVKKTLQPADLRQLEEILDDLTALRDNLRPDVMPALPTSAPKKAKGARTN